MKSGTVLFVALLALRLPVGAESLDACRDLGRRGRLAEQSSCYQKLLAGSDPYVRAEALWGLGDYGAANDEFRRAVELNPKNVVYRVRWGRLFLDRTQKPDAGRLFKEALEIDPKHAGAILGLALVASDGFDAKAVELAEKAASLDPNLAEARELLARLALEDGDERRAAEQADRAIEIDPAALDAMAVRASMDWLNGVSETPWMKQILEMNPVYGEAYATAGHFFVLNRRYEEGIEFFRKALKLNPNLLKARRELGVNLMRLGQDDEEARWHLEKCYNSGDQFAGVVNPLRLLDTHKRYFVTHKTDRTILRLHQSEEELLRPLLQAEMDRAMETYEKTYRMRLDRPVEVQPYPEHEDFAVRTLGMPGFPALGVTFGYVVAMDSPNGRPPGSFHWASTLWHELSHVYVLEATHHRVPRWFTEGMSVREESAVAPDWGDRLSPDVIRAMREKKLLPVAELDRGFLRPESPAQVVVSYFQAGRTCDYIAEKWGTGKLLDMMHAFGKAMTTPEVIEQDLGVKPEHFDAGFLKWLEAGVRTTLDGFPEWEEGVKKLAELAKAGRHDDVIAKGKQIRDVYPDYVEAGNVYELLAEAYLARSDKPSAVTEMLRYSRSGGRDPATLKKLAAFLEEQGRTKEAAETLQRLNYIYPRDEELHRRLGRLWMALGDATSAIREFRALVAMRPDDLAAAHFSLAEAYRGANQLEQAREEILLSLEAAPGYRSAQKLLLELNQ